MAYCVIDDVKAEFKSITFTGSDAAVTEADVTEFIVQADAEINSRIGLRYQVPVTAEATALSLLKMISIWLVSARIKEITEVKDVREEVNQDVKADSASRARKMLDQIAKGEINLIGATLASTADGVNSYVSANNVERVFKKDTDQW